MNLILIQASESWGEDYPYPTPHWFSAHQHWRGQKSSAGTVQLGHRGRWPWGASKVGLRRWLYHLFLPSVCVHAKLLQSCPTLCYPMDCSILGSSVYGILQARILEWVTMPSSRGSSRLRDWTHVSYIYLYWQVGSLPPVPPGKPFFLLGVSNYKDRLIVKPTYHQTLESAWVWKVEMCSQNTHEWTRRFFLRGSLSESLKHPVSLEGNQCQ